MTTSTSPRQRLLVTAALPYANGAAHMGHLVEYVFADMYVRAQRALGTDAILICASDAHGTPIELNAQKRGVAPEAMVREVREEHQRDFARFGVAFAHFGNTHDRSNELLVQGAYATLKEKGLLVEREQLGTYCPRDQRFLPDRFVKGTCPRCKQADQYGDVCESCGATYGPEDVVEPRCALCGEAPERRPTRHAFFALSRPEQAEFLRRWIDSGTLQEDVANYVRGWVDGGLKDWCITRDAPYFGFPVPDMPNKFFYVWLDAPFGYVSASQGWGEKNGIALPELWRSENTRIEHIIGKDIMYFHTLFWPAVLNATGYSLPAKVHVHGMLTVDGEKMSKSRGTFINARTFADHVEPEILRYYFATKYTPETRDIALSFADMVTRINGELVNKYVNLFSRLGRFVHGRLEGRLGRLPFTQAEATDSELRATQHEGWDAHALQLARKVVEHARAIEAAYRARDIARVTRELSSIADLGNEEMQAQAPWALVTKDPERARAVCTLVAAVCDVLVSYLWPIVPELSARAAKTFGTEVGRLDANATFGRSDVVLGPFERLLERLEPEALERVVEASKQPDAADKKKVASKDEAPKTHVKAPAAAGKAASTADATATLEFADFAKVQLKVGTVRAAEPVAKSNKLLRLQVDLGEERPRQIMAGIAKHYAPEAMVGRQVVVVANLKPAKIMGQLSEGMVLAGDAPDGGAVLLRPSDELPPGALVH